jgi:hypothetical protein
VFGTLRPTQAAWFDALRAFTMQIAVHTRADAHC